jgi:hypothetical protein
VASDEPIDELAVRRVKGLLRDIAEGPFVALIFDGDDLRVYASGLDADKLHIVEQVIESLNDPD